MDTSTALQAAAALMAGAAALMLGAYGRRRTVQLHHGALRWWLLAPWTVAAGAALAALWPTPGATLWPTLASVLGSTPGPTLSLASWQQNAGHLLAALLLLAWPVLNLVGLRRFHARLRLPGSEALDLSLLGLSWAVLAATAWLEPAWSDQAAAACALGLGLYGAAIIVGGLGNEAATPSTGPGHPCRTPGADNAPGTAAPLLAMALVMALTGCLSAGPVLGALAGGPGTASAFGAFDLAGARWGGMSAQGLSTGTPEQALALAAALGAVVAAFIAQWLLAERVERQLRDSRRRLRALANQDALTQVPNRRHFRDLASQALRHDDPGSAVLLIFDIDHFKHVNDEGGHAAGDRALCLVAGCMVEHLRTADVAGRHGGDEFVLLLRQADTADAMRVAARIVAAIQQRSPALQLPVLTLSFGMVQVGLAEPLDEALRRADQALYEAKRQGRSRAVAAQGGERQPVFSESRRLGLTAL